jgi:recombination protein RecT
MADNTKAVAKRMPFTVAIGTDYYKGLINRTLQDPDRSKRFIASIMTAVTTNPALQECDPITVLSGAFLGESLNLTPSPTLGQMYLIPFKDKNNAYGMVAVFVLGYKGYIQLMLRSGYYKKEIVVAVKEGEFVYWNEYTEELQTSIVQGVADRDALPTVGYYLMFEMVNGFRKAMYWSKEKMLAHADRYSKAFSSDKYRLLVEGKIPGISLKDIQTGKYFEDKNLYATAQKMSSFWYKDFDEMGKKTMIRHGISHWGLLSIEMQTAFDSDDKVVNEGGIVADVEEMPDAPEELAPPDDKTPPVEGIDEV